MMYRLTTLAGLVRQRPWIRALLITSALWQICELSSSAADFRGQVVDEKGLPLPGAEVTLWTQSGQFLARARTNPNGQYSIRRQARPIAAEGPLELMYEARGRHVRFIGQIYGQAGHDVTVVLMPEEGPVTYERVYDALANYERLYYVMRAASTLGTVTSHQRLQQLYGDRLLAIPDPNGNRQRDIQFRQRLRDDQIRLLNLKRTQIVNLYGL